MNTALWIVQVLLAAAMFSGTYLKLLFDKNKRENMMPWTAERPGLMTFTALADGLIGLGLILPPLILGSYLWVVFAAIALILLMIAACIFHLNRGEVKQIVPNIIFALLALFVAWGRSQSVV